MTTEHLLAGTSPPTDEPTSILSQSAAQSARRGTVVFLAGLSVLYLLLTTAIVFAVDRFWSANWDVEIFLGAARSFYDGGSVFDLYQKSRAAFPWPYPYPPLYALLLVPLVWLADLPAVAAAAPWAPLLAVRVPVVLADIGIAVLLYAIVIQQTGTRWLARLAAAAWLFTPILFYQTAIQAHQESIWLLPTLAAYTLLERRQPRQRWLAGLLLAVAVCLKQSAVIYVVPFGLFLLWQRCWRDLVIFAALFVVLFGGLALPFALYSGDFVHMVFQDVPNMPVQTQSWVPWLLTFKPYLLEQTRSTFALIRYASLITLGAAGLLSLIGLARQLSWYALGLVLTLVFFLLSQKVMAYHYPMLVPWLLATWLPARRLKVVTLLLVWTSWIVVSPYFAPWANPAHLPFYAVLGTLNSLLFLALLAATLVLAPRPRRESLPGEGDVAHRMVGWLSLLGLGFLLASLAHPLTTLRPESGTDRVLLVAGLLLLVLVLTVALWTPVARGAAHLLELPAGETRLRLNRRLVGAALVFAPLFFTWFTMTAEITKVIEKGLQAAWGL
ncbi:MAG: glycosyltransferase family 39 protein [Ardenticatenaceae bacterium]|nr:glycosyltransferase family 39 protein [Ardenticatenaceae bacterium]